MRWEFDPWVRKILWRRKWQPTPIFLPGESHGQRRLVGYSPWGCKKLDTTERACVRVYTHTHTHPWISYIHLNHLVLVVSPETKESEVKVAQLCPTLCHPMDYIVHGTLQARILEWVTFPFSRGSFQSRDWTQVSRIAGRFFTSWATRETQEYWSG